MKKILFATAALALISTSAFAASAITAEQALERCKADNPGKTVKVAPQGNGFRCLGKNDEAMGEDDVPAANTFKDDQGVVWTVTTPGFVPPSALHMTADAAKACPSLRIKLEPSKLDPEMTAEQKFRGDKRWHIVCDRG